MNRSLLYSLLILSGCVGTDVGNPPDDDNTVIAATLEFEIQQTHPNVGSVHRDISLDQAWLAIGSIHIGHGDCEAPESTELTGPFFVDLLSERVLPSPPVIEGATNICSLRIKLAAVRDDAPAPLIGRSLYIEGSDRTGAFVVESKSPRQLPYRGQAFSVENGGRYFDSFDPSDWADALGPQRNANDDASGGAVAAFFATMRDNSRIVHDANGDGELSNQEREVPVALPDQAVGP